jgi:flagellar basal body-associated protein FliL
VKNNCTKEAAEESLKQLFSLEKPKPKWTPNKAKHKKELKDKDVDPILIVLLICVIVIFLIVAYVSYVVFFKPPVIKMSLL